MNPAAQQPSEKRGADPAKLQMFLAKLGDALGRSPCAWLAAGLGVYHRRGQMPLAAAAIPVVHGFCDEQRA
jgi:hypothetical protein